MRKETIGLALHELPDPLGLSPLARAFDVTLAPPGSKSIANRVLLLAALSRGVSVVGNVPRGAEDVETMIAALGTLGARISAHAADASRLTMEGVGGRFRGNVALDVRNAGTAARFLAAAACLADGPVTLDGSARMRQRPMGELLSMLHAVGVTIDELGDPDALPIRVHPARRAGEAGQGLRGGELRIGRTQSSQFVSALALLAPFMPGGATLWFQPGITSPAYIDMTLSIMARWPGLTVGGGVRNGIALIRAGEPEARAWTIEPDASGASYYWAAAAVAGARARVPGLSLRDASRSAQGDAAFTSVLGAMGADVRDDGAGQSVHGTGPLRAGDFDLADMPDTAMTLAAAAATAQGVTTIRGLRTLRVKETDRIAAIVSELSKIGVSAETFSYTDPHGIAEEGIRITPPQGGIDCSPAAPRVEFETYNDHRMAMSLAIIGLRRPNVWIRNPRCVEKTYPGFWKDWARLYE